MSGSVCSVGNACVHRFVHDNLAPLIRSRLWRFINLFTYLLTYQLQTAGLLQECVVIRESMAHLPDAFTVDDLSDIIRYLCTFYVLSSFLYGYIHREP